MQKIVILAFLIIFVAGCRESSISDKSLIPENDNGIPDSVQDPPEGGEIGRNPAIYPGTHGNYKINKQSTLVMPDNHELKQMTTHNNLIFLLVRKKIVELHYEMLIVIYDSETQFGQTACEITDDGKLSNSLLVDDDYFYIKKRSDNLGYLKYDKETCELQQEWKSLIHIGEYNTTNVLLAKNNEIMLMKFNSEISEVNLETGLLEATIDEISFSLNNLRINSIRSFAIGQENRLWIFESYNEEIWLLNLESNTVGWFRLDTEKYPSFANTHYISSANANELYILTSKNFYEKKDFEIIKLKFNLNDNI